MMSLRILIQCLNLCKYKDELNIIILSFLSAFINFVYFRENENTRNIYSNIKLNLKKIII